MYTCFHSYYEFSVKITILCLVQRTCGGSSSYNNTYFVNPAFPSTMTAGNVCAFTIQQCNPSICQVSTYYIEIYIKVIKSSFVQNYMTSISILKKYV